MDTKKVMMALLAGSLAVGGGAGDRSKATPAAAVPATVPPAKSNAPNRTTGSMKKLSKKAARKRHGKHTAAKRVSMNAKK